MKYACALFDLDNTLLRRMPKREEQIFASISRFHPDVTLPQVERACAQSEMWIASQIRMENETGARMPDEVFLQGLLSVYQSSLALSPEACEMIKPILSGKDGGEYVAASGAVETLGALYREGIVLGIVSNNNSGVRETLTRLDLAEFFRCVILSEEVGLWKPNPEILRLACRRLGVACERTIYVGDHPFDVLCAHEAGMAAAWMPWNAHCRLPPEFGAPEYVLHGFGELPSALAGLSAVQHAQQEINQACGQQFVDQAETFV